MFVSPTVVSMDTGHPEAVINMHKKNCTTVLNSKLSLKITETELAVVRQAVRCQVAWPRPLSTHL